MKYAAVNTSDIMAMNAHVSRVRRETAERCMEIVAAQKDEHVKDANYPGAAACRDCYELVAREFLSSPAEAEGSEK
jgi:hypothetical protein